METLTKEEAIKKHRKLWNWLAETGTDAKYPNPDVERDRPYNNCYCCEYAKQHLGTSNNYIGEFCKYCPIDWGNDCKKFQCEGGNRIVTLYVLWGNNYNIEDRKDLARQIANLPEKEIKE